MKKLAIVIIVFLIVLNVGGNRTNFTLLNYFSGEYTSYSNTDSGTNSINLGFCYMNAHTNATDIVGESMEIEDLEVGSALKTLNARVVKTEYLDDGTTLIYAFSNLINDKVEVEGKNVNLQIAQKDTTFIIGWPLILGSY